MRSQARRLQPAGLLKRKCLLRRQPHGGCTSHLPRRSCSPTPPSSAGEEDRPARLNALATGTKPQPRRQQLRMATSKTLPTSFCFPSFCGLRFLKLLLTTAGTSPGSPAIKLRPYRALRQWVRPPHEVVGSPPSRGRWFGTLKLSRQSPALRRRGPTNLPRDTDRNPPCRAAGRSDRPALPGKTCRTARTAQQAVPHGAAARRGEYSQQRVAGARGGHALCRSRSAPNPSPRNNG